MSIGRALYPTVYRKSHLSAMLIMCYLLFMMVMMQQYKTLLNKVAVSRPHYEPLPPKSDFANAERWQKRSSERSNVKSSLKSTVHQTITLPSMQRKHFHDPIHPPPVFVTWRKTAQRACDGNFTGYENKFVRLRNAVLDRNYLLGLKGGEDIQAVINQSEETEYHQCRYG